MTTVDYLELRHGANVRGIATALTEDQSIDLTEEVASNIAKAFCVWLVSRTGKIKVSVAIGYDARLSSPILCEAAASAILSIGHDVIVTDLSTAPSMSVLLQDDAWKTQYPCDGAIMITGGNLPAEYNGFKFFFGDGSLTAEAVESMLAFADTYHYTEPPTSGQRIETSYMDAYAERFVAMIRNATQEELPLLNKKIVVDAGNGVGGFFVDKVLIPLGADTVGSQYLEPDGTFPHYVPDPENGELILSLSKAVLDAQADLGILFSADGERIGLVDQDGSVINRNRFVALMSAIVLAEKPGTIVTDSITSDGVTKFINSRGGKHHRFMRGYQKVIDEARRLNGWGEYAPLAIETSGLAAMLENDFHNDSTYLLARLLIAYVAAAKNKQTLSDLIADLEQPAQTLEARILIPDETSAALNAIRAICEYEAYALRTPYTTPAENNHEGCRVNYDEKHGNGWAMLRTSSHKDGVLVLIESASEHGAIKMAKDLYYFLRTFPYLDVTPLKECIDQERQRLINNIKADFYSSAAYLSFIFGPKTIIQSEDLAVSTEDLNKSIPDTDVVAEPVSPSAEAVADAAEPPSTEQNV
ncbi:MAG: phosphomannomutase/phosphoglucomutase [Clostridia bacterium]|nr:phosphomannomutase/phosphoglucomutase [Clostridia bacterium]